MALNITLAGIVTDSNDTPINANYQVFVNNTNANKSSWSNVLLTENTQINKNIGDPDLSSQDNVLDISNGAGEFALIAVWTNDTRLGTPSEFAFIVQELSGKNVYIQDIQLRPITPITCDSWTLTPRINLDETLFATSSNTNALTYEAKGITHYQYRDYFNEQIFNGVGPSLVEYDFGLGYSGTASNVPTTVGDHLVKIRVTDYYGNISECQKTSKVFYLVENCFNTAPTPIRTGDTLTVTPCLTGHTDQIITVTYDVYNVNEYTGLDFFTKDIVTFGNIPIKQYVTYFDGYNNVTIQLEKIISMDNIPPVSDIQFVMTDDVYTFSHNGTDVDGTIEQVKWDIYRNNPDSNGAANWSLYSTTGITNDLTDFTFNFTDLSGEFRIEAVVYDNLGASGTSNYIFEMECAAGIIIPCEVVGIDWAKKVTKLRFKVTRYSLKFKLVQNKLKFGININRIKFKLHKRILYKIVIRIRKIRFRLFCKK